LSFGPRSLSDAIKECCMTIASEPTTSTSRGSRAATSCGTRAELLGRAQGLVEAVLTRSDAAEEARRLPLETVQLMRAAGLHRILQPGRHGGAEAHFSGMADIVETISRACCAAGWCLTQYCSHNCLLGYWPAEGQDEIWGPMPDAVVAGVLIPACGKARRVADGWRLSGQWPFASGVYGADWFIAAAFAESGDGAPIAQMHAVPFKDYEILDTWHTAGLRGTGSADVRIEDCFVPDHRALPIGLTKGGGNAPGCAVNPAALYKLPAFAMFSINQSVVALGLAQAAYDVYIEQARTRITRMSGKSIADYSTAQVKVGEAHTSIKMARMLLHNCCDLGMAVAERSEIAPMELKTELRAKATMAGKLSAEAVDLLFQLSGGAGLYDKNPISRAMRDMNCIRGHITQNWDVNASNHGRVLMGLPSADPAL
jgi:3-hydroxy-9,10-secoandrosta-1,3,5(10)-triene-9,17-dione monooxygenase